MFPCPTQLQQKFTNEHGSVTAMPQGRQRERKRVALANPNAVMVHAEDATTTDTAMMRAGRLEPRAFLASPWLAPLSLHLDHSLGLLIWLPVIGNPSWLLKHAQTVTEESYTRIERQRGGVQHSLCPPKDETSPTMLSCGSLPNQWHSLNRGAL